MRALLALALAAAALGAAAPSASAKCGPDEEQLHCTLRCLEGRIHGYVC